MTRTWDPIRELDALRRQVEQIFDEHNTWSKPFTRFSFLPGLSARSYPLINLAEDKNNIYIEALAPGLNADTLEVTVLDDVLRLSGEKPSISEDVKPEAYHRNERSAGRFVRSIALPTPVNSDGVKAHYHDGLLNLTLPKAEEAKPKQIEVKVG